MCSSDLLGFFRNRYLLGAIGIAALLQVAVIVIPGLNSLFRVSHLTWAQWGISLGLSFAIIPVVEVVKWFQRRVIAKKTAG